MKPAIPRAPARSTPAAPPSTDGDEIPAAAREIASTAPDWTDAAAAFGPPQRQDVAAPVDEDRVIDVVPLEGSALAAALAASSIRDRGSPTSVVAVELDAATASQRVFRAAIGHYIYAGLIFFGAAAAYVQFDWDSRVRLEALVVQLLCLGIVLGLHVGVAVTLPRFRRTAVALSISFWMVHALICVTYGGLILLWALLDNRVGTGLLLGLVGVGLGVLFRWLADQGNHPAVWKQVVAGLAAGARSENREPRGGSA